MTCGRRSIAAPRSSWQQRQKTSSSGTAIVSVVAPARCAVCCLRRPGRRSPSLRAGLLRFRRLADARLAGRLSHRRALSVELLDDRWIGVVHAAAARPVPLAHASVDHSEECVFAIRQLQRQALIARFCAVEDHVANRVEHLRRGHRIGRPLRSNRSRCQECLRVRRAVGGSTTRPPSCRLRRGARRGDSHPLCVAAREA